jgi:hypothetical protein
VPTSPPPVLTSPLLSPTLSKVSFRDAHFGTNPVCELEGYRNAALLSLKGLKVLDGLEVSGGDRTSARDAFLDRVFQFNAKVEELARGHARETHAIEQRRKRVDAHAAVLTQEVVASLAGLEALVTSGRETIAQEQKRQIAVRNANAAALESGLSILAKRHASEVARRIAEEEACGREEGRLLTCLERRVGAEREQARVLAHLSKANNKRLSAQNDSGSGGSGGSGGKDGEGGEGFEEPVGGGGYACALLSEHAPPFQVLARHARSSQAFARHTDSGGLLHLLRCFQLFAQPLAQAFAQFDGSSSSDARRATASGGSSSSSAGGVGVQRLYWCGSVSEQAAVVVHGFAALAPMSSSSFVLLHSDPALALEHWRREFGPSEEEEGEGVEGEGGSSSSSSSLGLVGSVISVSCALSESVATTVSSAMRRRPTSSSSVIEHAQANGGSGGGGEKMMVVRYAAVTPRSGSSSSDQEGDEEESSATARGSGRGRGNRDNGVELGGGEMGSILLVPTTSLQGQKATSSSSSSSSSSSFTSISERLLPEAHCLVASGAMGVDRRRIEARLEEIAFSPSSANSSSFGLSSGPSSSYSPRPTSGGSGGSGCGGVGPGGDNSDATGGGGGGSATLLEELEALVKDEVARYEERVWEEVDPETADKLREQDAEVGRQEEALAAARGRIEGEREGQDALLRDFRARQQHGQQQQQQQHQPQQLQQQQQQQQPGLIPHLSGHRGAAVYGGGGGGSGVRGRENPAMRSSSQNHRPSSASLYASDPRVGR